MFELALSEWLLTPEYISANWTEEKLLLMFEKRLARIKRMAAAVEKPQAKDKRLSNDEFFMRRGIKVKPLA